MTHLGGGYQLSSAGGNLMGANHQLLELPLALHHQVGCIPAKTQYMRWSHWQLTGNTTGATRS